MHAPLPEEEPARHARREQNSLAGETSHRQVAEKKKKRLQQVARREARKAEYTRAVRRGDAIGPPLKSSQEEDEDDDDDEQEAGSSPGGVD